MKNRKSWDWNSASFEQNATSTRLAVVSLPPSLPPSCPLNLSCAMVQLPKGRLENAAPSWQCWHTPGEERGGNRSRAPPLWPNVLTPSHSQDQKISSLKKNLNESEHFHHILSKLVSIPKIFRLLWGKQMYCLEILIRLRCKDRQRAVEPFQG